MIIHYEFLMILSSIITCALKKATFTVTASFMDTRLIQTSQ